MTRKQALQHVTTHLVGYLQASTPDEIHETDSLQAEDQIAWAMQDVTRRLLKMGKRHERTRS